MSPTPPAGRPPADPWANVEEERRRTNAYQSPSCAYDALSLVDTARAAIESQHATEIAGLEKRHGEELKMVRRVLNQDLKTASDRVFTLELESQRAKAEVTDLRAQLNQAVVEGDMARRERNRARHTTAESGHVICSGCLSHVAESDPLWCRPCHSEAESRLQQLTEALTKFGRHQATCQMVTLVVPVELACPKCGKVYSTNAGNIVWCIDCGCKRMAVGVPICTCGLDAALPRQEGES